MLPGIVPTARLEFEVLLGPRPGVELITVRVEDPAGRLIALRTFPLDEKRSAATALDVAWRVFLAAIPYEALHGE